jgi:DNA-binding MarR family transcriptional regulator
MLATKVGCPVTPSPNSAQRSPSSEEPEGCPRRLELATRGLLEVTVTILERMDKTVGVTSLRALQSLQRRGPSQVTELANDLDMLVSTASRLSDRLSEAGLITRRVSPTNRRATQLQLTDSGRRTLDDLIDMRTAALREITNHMSAADLDALLVGAEAFTQARNQLTQRAPDDTPGR